MTSQPTYSNCEEKKKLLMAYEEATKDYSQAVWKLTRAVGEMAYSNYEALKADTAKARERSEKARQRLMEHVRTHKC